MTPAFPPFSSPPLNEAPPKLKTELDAAADDDDDDGISNPLTDGGGAVAGLALAPLPKENPPAGLVLVPLPKEKLPAGLAAPLPKEKPPAGVVPVPTVPKEKPPAGLAPLPKEKPPAGLVPLSKEKLPAVATAGLALLVGVPKPVERREKKRKNRREKIRFLC